MRIGFLMFVAVMLPACAALPAAQQRTPSPRIGIAGGAPLGASSLAVRGGAQPAPGIAPLPCGRQPGTNVNVGCGDDKLVPNP